MNSNNYLLQTFNEYICASKSTRCRLCLQKYEFCDFNNIFMMSFGNSSVAQYVANFADIPISKEDCFSKVVCKDCLKQLNDVETLRRRICGCNEYLNNLYTLYNSMPGVSNPSRNLKRISQNINDDSLETAVNESKSGFQCLEISENKIGRIEPVENVKNEDVIIKSENLPIINELQQEDIKIDIVEHKVFENLAVNQESTDNRSEKLITNAKSGGGKKKRKRKRWLNLNNLIYPCQYCDKVFKTSSGRGTHVMNKHKGKQYKCSICQEQFPTIYFYNVHRQQQHAEDKALECKECGKRLSNINSLEGHMDLHTSTPKYQCDICGKRFKHKATLFSHKNSHTDRNLIESKCQVCNRIIRSHNSRAMRKHMEIHSKVREKQCPKCGKIFTSLTGFRVHLMNHNGEFAFKCELCPKAYASKKSFNAHMAAVHSTVKPFACEICGKTFALKTGWYIHGKVHAKTNPFTCTICEKQFGYPSHLKGHMKSVHGIVETQKGSE